LRLKSQDNREEQGFQALFGEVQEQGVTGADLVNLTGEDLKTELGIKKYAAPKPCSVGAGDHPR
jgi:hypothetical protein